jgi:hypothetical protein
MKPKHLLALGVLAAVAAASLTAAQKPAPPQPTEQQKLKERVDALESQLKEAQAKADRAAMEKDYILRTQNHYEAYYKEVFSTQTHILWTIGITVTLLSVTLSVVFFVAGRFGFNIFDRRIDLALEKATAQLRTEFTEMLGKETQALREANSTQLKTLEEGLTKRITQLGSDLEIRSNFQNEYNNAYSAAMGSLWPAAADGFRRALTIYKKQQTRQLIPKRTAAGTICQLLTCTQATEPDKFPENAAKELATPLFSGLDEERVIAATLSSEFAPFLAKSPQRPTQAPQPGTASAPAAPEKPTTK